MLRSLMVWWVLVLAVVAQVDEWGRPLWPAEGGAPAGYPGALPGMITVTDKTTGETREEPKYPRWGFPELINYPGSVEHYRHYTIKYLPVVNPFNATTLVRAWPAAELPGAVREQFAEPIYYVPMYSRPVFVEQHRPPVAVARLSPGGANALSVTLGKLPPGLYAVRLVAALPALVADNEADPPRLQLTCTLNDGPGGAPRSYTRWHRAVDQFYNVGEWYFHAVDDREYTARITLNAASQSDLVVHTVDLHAPLATCPPRLVKQRAILYPAEVRAAAQAYYAANNQLSRNWGPNIILPSAKGLWQGEPLPPAERQARDDALWQTSSPETQMNRQNLMIYGKYDQFVPTAEEKAAHGTWEIAFETRYGRNWDRVRTLVNKQLNLEYTLADYEAGKPLPGPFPWPDAGWGVFVPERGWFHPVASAFADDVSGYQVYGHTEVGALCVEYFNRNNLHAARDAALLLCRLAAGLPATMTDRKHSLQQVVCRPAQCFSFNDPLNRRYTGVYGNFHLIRIARAYDLLFDYIKDNQELATAAGRYLPGIRTPDDLRAFLDQRLLLWPMEQMQYWRIVSSHETSDAALTLALIAQEPAATRPLMDWLFSSTWDYPLPLSGLQDYASAATTRDGTTSIGSYMYTAGGSPFFGAASQLRTYVANGGDPKYDMSDLARFPKPAFGAYFGLEGRVAGYWPLGIGDVGGVLGHGHWLDIQADSFRAGAATWQDPRLAWIVVNHLGRALETDAEWAALEALAAKQTRNPWYANRSRVLATWAGILESGTQHDDFRLRRAATVRVGLGWGHSHRDTLDLQLFAFGCQMTPDGGQRPGYGRPDCPMTMNHNVVEVDGDASKEAGNWEGHAWIGLLADMPGSPVQHAHAVPPANKPQVRYAQRTVALIDVAEGVPGTQPPSDPTLRATAVLDPAITLPQTYALDIYRVAGGKRHTYGFHGVPEDEFTVNAEAPRVVPPASKDAPDDKDAQYLRRYILPERQGAGAAPATVVATWRLGREPFEFQAASGNIDEGKLVTYKAPAPEQVMLGKNFNPDSPRRFTRLHLLDQQGARLLWGRWVSAPYGGTHGQWFTQLHVMHDGESDRESVFAGIVELYAGEPFVKAARTLPVTPTDTTALRPVAVLVETVNGQTNLHLADGQPGTARTVAAPAGTVTANGRYAFLSLAGGALRQASLAEGTALRLPGVVSLQPATAAYAGKVQAVDHLARHFTVAAAVPPQLAGSGSWEIGNDAHRGSLEVTAAEPQGAATRLRFRHGLELVSTRVIGADPATGEVRGKLVSILMGADEDNGMKPGMTDGLWATNDAGTTWWRCAYLGGSRADGYRYRLTGAPLAATDFPAGGSLRIFELGAGDEARLPTWASLRQLPEQPGVLELTANVPLTLGLPGTACEASLDGTNWAPLAGQAKDGWFEASLTADQLAGGRLLLRLKP